MSEDVLDRLERLTNEWLDEDADADPAFGGSIEMELEWRSATDPYVTALIAVARAAGPLLDQVACDTFCAVCHGPRPWAHNQHVQGCCVPAAQAALEALR